MITKVPAIISTEATPGTIHLAEPPIELPKQESFKLLDPGKGARTALRYQLAPESVEHTVETKLQSRQLDAQGAFSKPIELPTLRDGFAIAITKDQPRVMSLRMLPGEVVGAASPEAEQYQASWRTLLQGRRVTVAVDDRGQLGAITFADDPAMARSLAAKDELAQRMLGMLVPVPSEAVAPGARWQVATVLRHSGIYMKQTATYSLIERTAKRWRLHVKVQRIAEPQILDGASIPKGTTAELVAIFRLLEGDVEVDVASPLIAAGSLTVESRMHVKLKTEGQLAQEQIVEDTGSLTFSSK